MLTMTDNAATEIKNLVAQPEVPDAGGVRIAANAEGALTLSLAGEPVSGDDVVETAGARVFVEPAASQVLADKELDADVDPSGQPQFRLNDRD